MEFTGSSRQVKKRAGAHVSAPIVSSVPASSGLGPPKDAAAVWNDHLCKILIDLYAIEVAKTSADNGIKSQQWSVIVAQFAADSGGYSYKREQLQSRWFRFCYGQFIL